jgi:hypothetical protein
MPKYKIVRLYKNTFHRNHLKVIAKNLTLEEAREHCRLEGTSKRGVWFDAYEAQGLKGK